MWGGVRRHVATTLHRYRALCLQSSTAPEDAVEGKGEAFRRERTPVLVKTGTLAGTLTQVYTAVCVVVVVVVVVVADVVYTSVAIRVAVDE